MSNLGAQDAELAAVTFDEARPSSERVRALERLLAAVPAAEAILHLGRALASPSFALRHRAIHAAITRAPADPGARALVERALPSFSADRDTVVAGASSLGRAGAPVLLAITFEDPDALPEVRVKALEAALGSMSGEERATALDRALSSGVRELEAAAIRGLVHLGVPVSPLRLREAAIRSKPTTAVLIAGALAASPALSGPRDGGHRARAAAELVLLELLERPEPEVVLAALRALGAAGTTRSADVLVALLARERRGAIEAEARRALDLLRTRAREGAGALSLAEDAAGDGALSLTLGDGGELGLAQGEGGTLALAPGGGGAPGHGRDHPAPGERGPGSSPPEVEPGAATGAPWARLRALFSRRSGG